MRTKLLYIAIAVQALAARGDTPRIDWWKEAEEQGPAAPCERRAEASVAFDGGLEEWRQRPAIPLGLAHQTGFDPDWRGRSDLSATLWLAHSHGSLLLAAEVYDEARVVAPGGQRQNGDHLRLYVTARPEDDPATARAVWLVPPVAIGGLESPATALDGDSGEPLPGAVVAWRFLDRGYRVEARIPWPLLPGGAPALGQTRGLHLRVVDWDEPGGERAALYWPASIRPPGAPPEPPKPPGYDEPKMPAPWRPLSLGALRFEDTLDASTASQYLPTLIPLGAERTFYDGGEPVRVLCLYGLDPTVAAALRVYATDREGEVRPLARGDDWGEGAVAGASWSWRTPYDFRASLLLVGTLGEPDGPGPRSYGRIESVGAAYAEHLQRLADLRDRMLAAATAPGTSERLRRYIGSVLINLEDKEQGQEAWRNTAIREDLERLARDVSELESLFGKAVLGIDPYAGRKGVYLRGYVSSIDDTVQHYSVGIPDAWAPGKAMPLVISLHGYGFGRFLGHPAPLYADAVSVACFGRGNGDYKLWCEQDILTVIHAMLEDYGVDPDRIYCTGGSMGGTGSWHMATLFPDLFAAIAPTAGNANHHVWEEVWGWGQREPTFLTPFRDWLESTTSAYQYADNLRHVGTYCVHGTLDNICPVGHARTMTERLRQLGYDVVYEEHAGVGHGGFPYGTADRQYRYLMAHVRDRYPRHVTYRTSWYRYPGAYWVYIERFARVAQDAVIDARVEDQEVRVTTTNVQRFRLELNDLLLDTTEPVRILVDGSLGFEGRLPSNGVVRLARAGEGWGPGDPPAGLEKNPMVGGPIEHAFMGRFLLVCGTTGDRITNLVNRRMTEQAAEKWRRWGRGQRARVKLDYEVTTADIAESNLICYGGPDSNAIVAKVNDRLPVRIVGDHVVAGSEVFRGDDVGIKLCYPNPLNPSRYLCVFSGVTWRGTYDINGRFGNWFDWGIFDDRNWFDFAVFDARTQSPETFLLVGYFDSDWRLDEAVAFRGDPTLRAAAEPRRPPDPLAPLPAGNEVYLSQLTPTSAVMEKGVLAYDHSFAGRRITLDGMTFERGLGVHPQAEITYDIEREFTGFEAWVGVDLEGATTVSAAREEAERVAFQVYGDGRLLADTGEMRWNSRPRRLVVNVEGVKELRLVTRALDGRKWLFGDASWGLARLTRRRVAAVEPPPVRAGADRLSLDGEWWFESLPVGAGVAAGAQQDRPDLPTDARCTVPGTIPVALMERGELPDLYRNDHIRRAAELASREWWLYRRFDLPAAWQGRRVTLRLRGVCQHGDVWLNGESLGAVEGPYVLGGLDATAAARFGEPNLLAVRILAGPAPWTAVPRFDPPPRERVVGYGVGYGLDAGGTALPLGITGGVELRATGAVRLGAPLVRTEPAPEQLAPTAEARGQVTVTCRVALTNDSDQPVEALLRGRIEALDGQDPPLAFERRVPLAPREVAPVAIAAGGALRRWWPATVGPRTIYRLSLELIEGGMTSDRAQTDFGVRTVALVDADDATVEVNGYPMLLRIAEWRPIDRFFRASPERTESLLREALACGFNAIRVWAGGGADDDLRRLCDRLGVLVIEDLPLLGDVGAAPADDVRAAVDGVVESARNHPSLVAFTDGLDLPETTGARERRRIAAERIAALAPESFTISGVSSAVGEQVWEWWDNRSAFDRRSRLVRVLAVRVPDAPPAALDFLDREALPRNQQLAPWPLTLWWGLRGGSQATLDEAQRWLGAGSDGDLAGLLRRWQAEATRRQLAAAAGRAVMVSTLNESWPRVGGALIDYSGRPRPARDTVRRFLAGPYAFARASTHEATVGDVVHLEVYASLGAGAEWWEGRPGSWREVRTRVQRLDGMKVVESKFALGDEASGLVQLGALDWEIDDAVKPGAYLAVTEVVGAEVEPDLIPLAVRAPLPLPRARAVWLAGDPPTCAGVQVVGRSAARPDGIDVVYLGPGLAEPPTERELGVLYEAVRSGAGVLIDGPPEWLTWSPLVEWLPARPADGPIQDDETPLTPVVLAADHPALAGLRGALPAGLAGSYADVGEGAEVLAQFGVGRPLLVEGRYGRGRVVLLRTPRDYRRRMALWEGRDRLYTGLLAYCAKLPYGDVRKLLDAPQDTPLAALRDLPAAPVKVTVATAPLVASADEPAVREVVVRNDGATPIPLVEVWMTGLPRGATAVFSHSSFPLLPGASQRTILTLRCSRRLRFEGKLTLVVEGWGAVPTRIELPAELG